MMTSTRPYLIRAFYDWIVDNNCTPHIVVNAKLPSVMVPEEYIEEGQIVLNIGMSAVSGLLLGEVAIEFQARFGGKIRKVYAPMSSILAIYAKENGRGMVFAEDETDTDPPSDDNNDKQKNQESGPSGKKNKPSGKPPHLTVVK